MPEMSGIEACEEIKNIDQLSQAIIFLSARSEDYTQISAYDAADDYISKPNQNSTKKILILLKKLILKKCPKDY